MKKIYTLVVATFFLFAANGFAQDRIGHGNNSQSAAKNQTSVQPVYPMAISSYTATVWADNAGSPGAVLGSAPAISILNLDTSFYATQHIGPPTAIKGFYNNVATFSSPVTIPANRKFWVGITFSYAAGDSAGLVSSYDHLAYDAIGATGECKEAGTYTFEQYANNSWHSVDDGTNNSWGLDIAWGIYPVLNMSSTNDTLTNHWHTIVPVVDTALTYNACSSTSFVGGNNCYGDISKVQKFDSAYGVTTSSGTIKSLLLWFGGKIVNTAGVNEINSNISDLKNYPNPVNDMTTINYNIVNPSDIIISVYDVTGKKMLSLNEGKQPAGSHSVKVNTSALTSGMYFYTLNANGQQLTKKMSVVR